MLLLTLVILVIVSAVSGGSSATGSIRKAAYELGVRDGIALRDQGRAEATCIVYPALNDLRLSGRPLSGTLLARYEQGCTDGWTR